MNIFKGVEVEGTDRGQETIFIPKNAKNRKDFLYLAKSEGIKRLYFGAGNDRGIHDDVIPLLYCIPLYFSIFLEITEELHLENIPQDILKRINIVFVKIANINSRIHAFKIETTKTVIWYDTKPCVTTLLNDPIYEGDIEI